MSTKFEYFVMTLIALNTIVLMMKVRLFVNHFLLVVPLFKSEFFQTQAFLLSSYIVGRWNTYSQMSPLMTLTLTTSMSLQEDNLAIQLYKKILCTL